MQIDEVCKVAKALSEPNRIEILNLVSNEEMYAFEILKQFDITQPTLSHHMKLLTDSGLLYMRKEGKMSLYSINKTRIDQFIEFLNKYQSME